LDKFSLVKQMRLTNAWSSPLHTVFSLSITLLYVLCLCMRILYFLLRMILLDVSINLKSVRSHFTRSYQATWKMKYYSSHRLLFNFDKPSNVKNSHVTACFSPLSKGRFCLISGFFLFSVWKQTPMPFKCNDVDAT